MTRQSILLNTALEQGELIRSGHISARELLELHVRQYENHHERINAVVFTCLEKAREVATLLDAELTQGHVRGPLHGVTMTVKDSYDLVDTPSTWGIPELRDNLAKSDSIAVERLKNAGLVIYGKTNVPYRIADWQSFNAIYGTTNNPWNLERTPGGVLRRCRRGPRHLNVITRDWQRYWRLYTESSSLLRTVRTQPIIWNRSPARTSTTGQRSIS